MEQKSYKFEIVNRLLKKEEHVRKIAKELKTNHMIISRKMKELFEENIVDFREEGKNKVYFLKKNAETKNFVYMTENYKLIKLLSKYQNLRNIIERIQKDNKIKLAIIFGSYSKNDANKNSDVDIFIETKDKKIKEDLERTDSKISIKIGKYDKNNLLIREIEKNHVVIKGVELFYEKNRIFD